MVRNPRKLIVGISAEGSVNLLRGQLKAFNEKGYQTYLLGPNSERVQKFCQQEGCTHLHIDIEREIALLSDIKTLFKIIIIFKKVQPDVINLGTPKISLLGMIAGWILGVKKRIYTCRGFRFEHEHGLKKKILIRMEKITSSLAHQVVAISPSVREFGVEHSIFTLGKSRVINKGSSNGVDLSLFDRRNFPQNTIQDMKVHLGLDETHFIFGFVGRIVDRKGIRELYIAFSKLYSENPRLRLLIVGPFEEGQIKDVNIISDLESHPGVILVGRKHQEEVPLYLSLMDIFVLPAWWEGFGNVIIQASALGIPVISTYGTGTRDAVSENFSGLLVPVKDSKILKEEMHRLRTDSSLRRTLGENGVQWSKNFQRETIWEELHQIYKS